LKKPLLAILILTASIFADLFLLGDSPERTIILADFPANQPISDNFGERIVSGQSLSGRLIRVAVPKGSEVEVRLENPIWSEWSLPSFAQPERIIGGWAEYIRSATIRGVEFAEIDFIPEQIDEQGRRRRLISAEIVIEHRGGGAVEQDRRLYHPAFERILRRILINPESALPKTASYSTESWSPSRGAELLVVAHPPFADELAPWTDWKLFAGMPTIVANTSVTGLDKNEIKAYIQNAYDTWEIPPVFVLLVGDSDDGQVPTWEDWGDPCTGDNEYGCVDGDDYYPEIFPGRWACDTEDQIATFVAKHLNYEMRPDTVDKWTLRSVGLVREEDCPFDPHGSTDSSYMAAVTYALAQCDSAGFISAELFTKCSGATSAIVRPFIEGGCNFISYRGQGVSDWWDPFGGLQQLATGAKASIMVSITCAMGGFHGGDGLPCETSTRAGNALAPRGSVAFIGQAVISSNSIERSSLSKHIFEGFFPAGLNWIGAAHTYGKIEMIAEFGPTYEADYEYKTSTLVGSPDMMAWTGPIRSPELEYLTHVPVGEVSFDVTIRLDGMPVEGARAAVHCDSVFSFGLSDSAGRITLSFFTSPGVRPVLVVTGANLYPFADTLEIIHSSAAIFPVASAFEEIVGNSDGFLNPGETIRIRPRVVNYGVDFITGLFGMLRFSPEIVPIDANTAFPGMGTWDTTSGDELVFSIPSDFPATDSIPVSLYISGHSDGPWTLPFLPIQAVHRLALSLESNRVWDEPLLGGNDDGTANPGETVELSVLFENSAFAGAIAISAALEGSPSIREIVSGSAFAGISPHSAFEPNPRFVLSISPTAPAGDYPLRIVALANCGTYEYIDTFELSLAVVGEPRPSSPWIVPVGELVLEEQSGDGDSIFEPGESVSLRLGLANIGNHAAAIVTAHAVASPFCIPVSPDSFGTIGVGDSAFNHTGVVFTLPFYTPPETLIYIPVEAASPSPEYSTRFVVPVVVGIGSAIGETSSDKPFRFTLTAYPNPFNSAVGITAPKGAEIEIFDVTGRRVAQLPNGGSVGAGFTPVLNDGAHDNERDGARPSPTAREFTWSPSASLGSGVYLVRAVGFGYSNSCKIVFIK